MFFAPPVSPRSVPSPNLSHRERGKKALPRIVAVAVIAAVATGIAAVATHVSPLNAATGAIDDAFYDAVYKLRNPEVRDNAPVTLIEVDDASLNEVDKVLQRGWPWPRDGWGYLVQYLDQFHPKAIVFDLLFNQRSAMGVDDDKAFADLLNSAKTPIVFAFGGGSRTFTPPTKSPPLMGDSDVTVGKVYREYLPTTPNGDSLALAALKAAKQSPALPEAPPFRLRYHGPHRLTDGKSIYPSLKASSVIFNAVGVPNAPKIDPKLFENRYVIIGAIAEGTYDLKSAPTAARYPGVEVHATAIDNLVSGDQVKPVSLIALSALCGALLAAFSTIIAPQAWLKALIPILVVVGLLAASANGMLKAQMHWLPPTEPTLAIALATLGGLIWSYRLEDARARFLLKALSRSVSPVIAQQLSADPSRLAVGGQQREMSVLFSDLAGFTDLTERLGERIEPVLNTYLAEMSGRVFQQDGTIDKFIGDAMMVFWNAPIDQADHAIRACRAALAIAAHEKAIAPQLAELGAANLHTRIGIHTGPVVVGFFGSAERLSYTAIGDSVNLAARLEPANKIYHTQICVSEATATLARGEMLFRPVDRLRVYGRQAAIDVFELIAEAKTATTDQRWLAEMTAVAYADYLSQQWSTARASLLEILNRHPDDGPARVLLDRVTTFEQSPPPPEWDGVFTARSK